MRDQLDDVVRYYRANGEDERLTRAQQLELLVTTHLLARYIPPQSRVLELGAGTGQYTAALAAAGHTVTALELTPELTAIAHKRLDERGARATLITADARDVLQHTAGPFDVTLVMGPFYHLVDAAERYALMDAITNITRGIIVTTHLTRVGLMGYMLTRYPTWLADTPEQAAQIIERGYLVDHPRNGEFRGYFASLDEVIDLHQRTGREIIGMHSQDPCIGSVDEIFSQLPDALKLQWAKTLADVSHDPLALGSGRSLLCVSRAGPVA